ncbi:TIGR02147 family protein [Bdellovibrio sp. HCB274]|uniref:TIGR02147 family protein n=1 Tax=Bdellovibrio sp. HCB274 TaxID=3394361 RepID=UPI0039B39074
MLKLSYRELLKEELAKRIASNSNYSLRAMALQLKISASMLSAILNGKRNLSPKSALDISKALKFDKKKTEYFVTLVQFEGAKTDDARSFLQEKIMALTPRSQDQQLDVDIFNMIAEWYHVPILQMTHTTQPDLSDEAIAKHLGITKAKVTKALERLRRLELLKQDENGVWRASKSTIVTSSPIPNKALRHFHSQMLGKAITSLETQGNHEKFVGSETFAFNETDLQKANDILEECFAKIVRLAGNQKDKKNVYHLGIQLFRINEVQS